MRFIGVRREDRRKRRLIVGTVAALLFLALLGAAFRQQIRQTLAESIDQELRFELISLYSLLIAPPLRTADLAPVAHTDERPYAINVFFEQEVEEAKIRRSLEMIKEAGFTTIKQQLVWAEIETPAKGNFGENDVNWAKYDRIVRLAAEYGIGVIFRVDTSPEWSRPANPKLETPPYFFEDYGDFVEALGGRYRGQVRYYQIWNEPNLAFEWGGAPPDPTGYTRLLQTASVRLKGADPNAVVISAALAPTIEESDFALSDLAFLQKMYDSGAKSYFDILATNAYGLRHGPDDWRLGLQKDVNFSRPILLRELMVQNGDAGRPIWAAEVGWNALPPNFGEEPRYGVVTRERQASYTARAYRRAEEEWPWMGALALWHFRMVNPKDSIQQQYYFNIVSEQFEPFPLFYSMRDLTHEEPITQRGYHSDGDWTLRLSPGWTKVRDIQAVLGEAAVSSNLGESVAFSFWGSSLDAVFTKGPEEGCVAVKIDGNSILASELSRINGRSLVSLRSDNLTWGEPTAIARGLPAGNHTAHFETSDLCPNGGANPGRVAFDGVIVDGPWPQQRLYTELGLFGLLIIGLGLSLKDIWPAKEVDYTDGGG